MCYVKYSSEYLVNFCKDQEKISQLALLHLNTTVNYMLPFGTLLLIMFNILIQSILLYNGLYKNESGAHIFLDCNTTKCIRSQRIVLLIPLSGYTSSIL